MKTAEKFFDKTRVVLYPAQSEPAPVIYSNDYSEAGDDVIAQCRKLGCPAFHLVTISHISWDRDMSPWPHEPVVSKDDHFTGGADAYMAFMEKEIVPYAEAGLQGKITKRIIAGYSMAGLFAAYAPFISDRFDAAIAASGSLWYPGFADYFVSHEFVKKPEAFYFSLGTKETKTRNPALQTTGDVMQKLCSDCKERGIRSVYERNPGNHYTDSVLRMAKGITWVLGSLADGK